MYLNQFAKKEIFLTARTPTSLRAPPSTLDHRQYSGLYSTLLSTTSAASCWGPAAPPPPAAGAAARVATASARSAAAAAAAPVAPLVADCPEMSTETVGDAERGPSLPGASRLVGCTPCGTRWCTAHCCKAAASACAAAGPPPDCCRSLAGGVYDLPFAAAAAQSFVC